MNHRWEKRRSILASFLTLCMVFTTAVSPLQVYADEPGAQEISSGEDSSGEETDTKGTDDLELSGNGRPEEGQPAANPSAAAVETEQGAGPEQDAEDADARDSGNGEEGDSGTEVFYEEVDLGGTETSAWGLSAFSLGADGTVALKSGQYEKWIDRIDVPDYAKEFYNKLAEASDNDGTDDFLIEDQYFSAANAVLMGGKSYNVIPVTTLSGVKPQNNDEFANLRSSMFSEASSYIRAVYDAFDRDHPEVFWLSGVTSAINSSVTKSDGAFEMTIYFILNVQGDSSSDVRVLKETEIKAAISTRNSNIQTIRGGVQGSDSYDLVTYFNDWLTKHNEYNTNSDLKNAPYTSRECIGALSGSAGLNGPVCEGYARAFKVLCDSAGIPCVLVDGTAVSSSGGGAHMWNYVQLDGGWYAMDVTWNDPVGGSSGVVSGFEGTKWSLAGSDTVIDNKKFIESHPVTNRASNNGTAFTNGPVLSTDAYTKKAAPTVSLSQPASVTYNGKPASVTAPAVTLDGSAVSNPVITYSYRPAGTGEAFASGMPVNAGSYEIKAHVAAGAGYSSAESNAVTLTITQAQLTISANAQTITYGENVKTDIGQAACSGLADGESLKAVTLSAGGTDAGTYDIVLSDAVIAKGDTDTTANYNITYKKGVLTINKAECQDKTQKSQSSPAGRGTFAQPSFTGAGGGSVEGATVYSYVDGNGSQTGRTYDQAVEYLAGLGAGAKASIGYTFTPADSNYNGPVTGTIEITIVDIMFYAGGETATADNAVTLKENPVYGDSWKEIATVKSGLSASVNGAEDSNPKFTLRETGVPAAGEQEFSVLYEGTISGNQYTDVIVCVGKVTIGQAPLTVKADDRSITYGDDPEEAGGTVTSAGFVNGETDAVLSGTLAYAYDYNQYGDAGAYTVTPSGLTSSNYKITFVPGTLTVNPRPAEFEWSGETEVTYDGNEHGVTARVTNALNKDAVNVVGYTGNKGVNAASYTARVTALDNGNYTVTGGVNTAKEWKIRAKSLESAAIALGEGLTFNGKDQTQAVASVTLAGTVLTPETDYTIEGAVNKNAGTYTLKVNGKGNYSGTVSCEYEIAPTGDIPKEIEGVSSSQIMAPKKAESLEEVELPEGWVWADPKAELVPGGWVTVTAVPEIPENYVNYDQIKIEVSVSQEPSLILEATDDSYIIGRNDKATIKTNGALSEFREVKVDGGTVDSASYTLKEGSTILTFTKAYMDSLSAGNHKVEMYYTVGSVETVLRVAKADDEEPSDGTNQGNNNTRKQDESKAEDAGGKKQAPKTKDSSAAGIYLAAMSGAAGIMCVSWTRRRKRRHSDL